MRPVTSPGGAPQDAQEDAQHSRRAASAMASSGSTGALSGVCGETTATPGVRTRPAVPRALTLTPEPCSSAASPVVSRSSDALHITYGTQPSLAQSGYGGPAGWRPCLEVMLST